LFIREARPGDAAAIAMIENTAPSPWAESLIIQEINQTYGICLVTSEAEATAPLGWCCTRLLPPEAELLKITILPDHRKTGLGSLLLKEQMHIFSQNNCDQIFAEVREKNHLARRFYTKAGFQEEGRRDNYYRDPADNCIILKLSYLFKSITTRENKLYENH